MDVTQEREAAEVRARARHPAGKKRPVVRDWDAEATWLGRLPPGPETDAKRVEWIQQRTAAKRAEIEEGQRGT